MLSAQPQDAFATAEGHLRMGEVLQDRLHRLGAVAADRRRPDEEGVRVALDVGAVRRRTVLRQRGGLAVLQLPGMHRQAQPIVEDLHRTVAETHVDALADIPVRHAVGQPQSSRQGTLSLLADEVLADYRNRDQVEKLLQPPQELDTAGSL